MWKISGELCSNTCSMHLYRKVNNIRWLRTQVVWLFSTVPECETWSLWRCQGHHLELLCKAPAWYFIWLQSQIDIKSKKPFSSEKKKMSIAFKSKMEMKWKITLNICRMSSLCRIEQHWMTVNFSQKGTLLFLLLSTQGLAPRKYPIAIGWMTEWECCDRRHVLQVLT